jgi:hypothetical protein
MTKPKQIPRLGRRINCKEVAMLLNELNNLDGTRFRPSGVFAHITQMGIVIPPNPGEDQLFRMWLTSFVKCLNTRSLKMKSQQVGLEEGLKQEALDAIRALSNGNIPLGYTLRRIFEYVRNDLQIADHHEEIRAFREARVQTLKAMKMLIGWPLMVGFGLCNGLQ